MKIRKEIIDVEMEPTKKGCHKLRYGGHCFRSKKIVRSEETNEILFKQYYCEGMNCNCGIREVANHGVNGKKYLWTLTGQHTCSQTIGNTTKPSQNLQETNQFQFGNNYYKQQANPVFFQDSNPTFQNQRNCFHSLTPNLTFFPQQQHHQQRLQFSQSQQQQQQHQQGLRKTLQPNLNSGNEQPTFVQMGGTQSQQQELPHNPNLFKDNTQQKTAIIPPPPPYNPGITGKKSKRRKIETNKASEVISCLPSEGKLSGGEVATVFFTVSAEYGFERFLNQERDERRGSIVLFGERVALSDSIQRYEDCKNRVSYYHKKNNKEELLKRYSYETFLIDATVPTGRSTGTVDVTIILPTGTIALKNGYTYIQDEENTQKSEKLIGDDIEDVNEEVDSPTTMGGDAPFETHDPLRLTSDQFRDIFGGNALFYAAAQANLKLVERLVRELSFEVDEQDLFGFTPVDVARHFGRSDILEFLKKNSKEEEKDKTAASDNSQNWKTQSSQPPNERLFTCSKCDKNVEIDYEGKMLSHECKDARSKGYKFKNKKLEEFKFMHFKTKNRKNFKCGKLTYECLLEGSKCDKCGEVVVAKNCLMKEGRIIVKI